jgi:hypothetical protein
MSSIRPVFLLILGLWPAVSAAAQPAPAVQIPPQFRVRLHVSAAETTRTAALAALTAALRPVRDVDLTERDPDYILSLVILPISTGGYAVSIAAMNVHSEAALGAFAGQLPLGETDRARLIGRFKGAGALIDQRVATGGDVAVLCADIAAAFNTDTLGPLRRAAPGNPAR